MQPFHVIHTQLYLGPSNRPVLHLTVTVLRVSCQSPRYPCIAFGYEWPACW